MARKRKADSIVPDQSTWVAILHAASRPITFFGLVCLVTLGIAGTAQFRGDAQTSLLAIGLVSLIVLVVAPMAVWKPFALMGMRTQLLADNFAAAMVRGMDGGVANFENPKDRARVWSDLIVAIKNPKKHEIEAESEFRQFLADAIYEHATSKFPTLKAAIEATLKEAREG